MAASHVAQAKLTDEMLRRYVVGVRYYPKLFGENTKHQTLNVRSRTCIGLLRPCNPPLISLSLESRQPLSQFTEYGALAVRKVGKLDQLRCQTKHTES